MEVIDGFLPEWQFFALNNLLMGKDSDFPWYYTPFVDYVGVSPKDDADLHNCQMHHWLLRPWDLYQSPFLHHIVGPVMEKLNSKKLFSAKTNMQFRSPHVYPMVFHKDVGDIQCRTVVLYMNTTDGPTIFENGNRVDCVANRAVIFDSQLLHCSSTPSNSKNRCVININCE